MRGKIQPPRPFKSPHKMFRVPCAPKKDSERSCNVVEVLVPHIPEFAVSREAMCVMTEKGRKMLNARIICVEHVVQCSRPIRGCPSKDCDSI